MTTEEFDTAVRPSLQFVLDHLTECRNGVGKRKETHCGKTPVAICTDPTLPADDNLFPVCSECLIKDGGENGDFLPLAEFVNLLIEQGILLPNVLHPNHPITTNDESE